MPNEFDFKNFRTIEEFSKTIEGSKYFHDIYLKAVNHPIRKEILKIMCKEYKISSDDLFQTLKDQDILSDEFVFRYNIDFLIKSLCIKKVLEGNEIFYEITQGGKIVEFL